MSSRFRLLVGLGVLVVLAFPAVAGAGHTTTPKSPNLTPLGHIEQQRLTGGAGDPAVQNDPQNPDIHTDIAFWGTTAVQGTWLGFHLRDISNPNTPQTISYTSCRGNQGDVIVYRNIVVRSWNSPASTTPGPSQPPLGRAETNCDGEPVAAGFEGIHVFDITNRANPTLVAQVALPQGSHTATAVPDPQNGRLLVYNSASSAASPQIDIVSIPLTAPQNAALVRSVPAGGACHDISVIFGDANLATCAGGNGFRVFSIGGPRGGSKTFPELLYRVTVPTVTIGHSAAFSWNGEIIIFGHEPGGGAAAECEAADEPAKKSFYFYRASDGALLGTWVLPRPQGANENCTLHNFNTVPFLDRHILVHGSYQAGTGVVDFTNPAAPVELAWADPPAEPVPPAAPNPALDARFCAEPVGCALGGAWATYWYNGPLYETHISEGLNIWQVTEPWWNQALNLPHMNPQTQEDTMTCEVRATGRLRARRAGTVTVNVSVWDQTRAGLRVRLRAAGVTRTLTTNDAGNVRATIRATRAGTLRINVLPTLNMDACSTTRRIAPAPRRRPPTPPQLTGRNA
jgi:hypothetical protein